MSATRERTVFLFDTFDYDLGLSKSNSLSFVELTEPMIVDKIGCFVVYSIISFPVLLSVPFDSSRARIS